MAVSPFFITPISSYWSSIRPSLDVNGIWGGYIGEGAKTVLPSKAYAKISMRLVPNQNSETITKLFKQHFESIAPDYVKVKVTPHHGGEGVVIPTDFPAYVAAKKAMESQSDKDFVGLAMELTSILNQQDKQETSSIQELLTRIKHHKTKVIYVGLASADT